MIDLAQSLHVIGHERDWHYTNFSNLLRRQVPQRAAKRRLQPLAGTDLTLVAEPIAVRPSSALHNELNGFFNLTLIWIALCDHGERNTVSAENQLRTRRAGETAQRFIYFFYQGFQIKVMAIKRFDTM